MPQGLTGKAAAYLDAQWSKPVRVFDHGFVPIDTNRVENAARPFALGPKNWLFGDTVGGAEASANPYSVVETASANRLEPWAYLQHVFAELPRARSLDDVDALLPDRVQLRKDVPHAHGESPAIARLTRREQRTSSKYLETSVAIGCKRGQSSRAISRIDPVTRPDEIAGSGVRVRTCDDEPADEDVCHERWEQSGLLDRCSSFLRGNGRFHVLYGEQDRNNSSPRTSSPRFVPA